jgi:hypothetical protein
VIATLVVRKPFTLPYAKEDAPEEFWDSPVFLRINYVISSVWAAAFAFTSIVGFIGIAVLKNVEDFWTGWVLQLAAIFFAVAFTEFYPDHAVAKAALGAGEPPTNRRHRWSSWSIGCRASSSSRASSGGQAGRYPTWSESA